MPTRMGTLVTCALAASAVLSASCGSPPPPPPPVTVTEHVPAPVTPPTSSAPPVPVTLPDVEGRNLQIVSEELTRLGLTNVSLASADESDKVVLYPPNWTAVSIEPAPGETVMSNQTVVVTATKEH